MLSSLVFIGDLVGNAAVTLARVFATQIGAAFTCPEFWSTISIAQGETGLDPSEEVAMTAWTDAYDGIKRVMQLSIGGLDVTVLRKSRDAFHPDPGPSSLPQTSLFMMNLSSESFEMWATPPSSCIVVRITSTTQVGDAAVVQISSPSRRPEIATSQ